MYTLTSYANRKKSRINNGNAVASPEDILRQQAFDNSLLPNILSTAGTGKVVLVNTAACKLLGYTKKELLTKKRSHIFAIKEESFREMLKQRSADGQSTALVTGIKKNGNVFSCEITSAVFIDNEGVEKAITTIRDMSQSILDQKNIDVKKDKIVAENIELVILKQKGIDSKNKKEVAANIVLAKLKQDGIDSVKEKIVAENIKLAKSKQKDIDTRNNKIVADNIVLAKSKQKVIDARKDKAVAENIVLALEKADARLAANNEWIKYIAKASYDVMWDWDRITGEIYVGESVSEVFGYRVHNDRVSFDDFSRCLLPAEKDAIEKRLSKKLASSARSWKDSFMFSRSDGTVANVMCRASIIRDSTGMAIRLIGAIHDVSRLQQLEQKLVHHAAMRDELRGIFHEATHLSFDGIWYWNLLTNDFILGEGFQELFGYPLKNNTGSITHDWSKYIHPDDKKGVEKSIQQALAANVSYWQQTYRFTRANGTVASVLNRASIIRQENGKPCRMIGAMHDLSKQNELEQKLHMEITNRGKMLAEYTASFKLAFNSSSDVFYNADLLTSQVIMSEGYEKEFGYKITGNTTPVEDWLSHIHPADKEMVMDDYTKMLGSSAIEWKCSYRFLRADHSVVNVVCSGILLRDTAGKAYRMIGSMHDVSKEKVLEERLAMEIKIKEKQIADATEDAKNSERSDIGKELHDNINQLLGASRMYLQMAKRGGDGTEMYLSRSSEYTLTAIEEIRKLTKGLITDTIKNLGLAEAILNISKDIMETNALKITCVMNYFKEEKVNEKFKLNVFRIVQEQLNNILKHARAEKVMIGLSQNRKSILLSISDDGEGFDTCKKQEGVGIANIKSRAASYNGNAEFVSFPGKGCILSVTFPIAEVLLKKNVG